MSLDLEKDTYFFKAENLQIDDLFDWSKTPTSSEFSPKKIPKRKQEDQTKTGTLVKVNDEDVALFRYRKHIFAVKEKCPHLGGPLHLGDIEQLPDGSLCVRCPWHHWCMDLSSGRVLRPRGKENKTRVFETKFDKDGHVLVGFDSLAKKYFDGEEEF